MIHTISEYTAQYDDANSAVRPRSGDQYKIPEDPDATGTTADGREWDAFKRRMQAAGVECAGYSHSVDGWDYYDICQIPADELC